MMMTCAGEDGGTSASTKVRPSIRLQTDDLEVVFGDGHSFQRVAPLIGDEKVEGPAVAGDGLDRFRLLLPREPLRGGRAGRPLRLAPDRLDQHESIGSAKGGGVSRTP